MNEIKGNFSIILICVLIFSLISVSFAVSLAQFVENDEDIEVSEPIIDLEQSLPAVSVESVEQIEKPSSAVSEYLDKISLEKKQFKNTDALFGELALIDSTSIGTSFVSEQELVPIHSNRTGKYDLKDYTLRLKKEAMDNFDRFIMSFYAKCPNNGLGISEAYLSSADVDNADLALGTAVKFTTYKTSNKLTSEDFSYLKEQAFKFGIIQRFPQGKTQFTGVEENLSLYRYVGLAHSCYMNHYNLSLEEYIDKIKTEKVIQYKNSYEDSSVYVIYYVPVNNDADTTVIDVPAGEKYTYSVSGDGRDGFIVTVKIS